MADDWRVTVDFDDEADGTDLVEWLQAARFEAAERGRFGDRVIVSRDGARVYLYADSDERAREALIRVEERLAEAGRAARLSLAHWHPVSQEWEDAEVPLPQTEAEVDAEEDVRQAREAAESLERGYAAWEVRVELSSPEETARLAERLESEGIPVVRRHRYLLAGAANEDEADALADRLRSESPSARIEVEPGGASVWEVMPQNPFAIFGGLGG
ncbi:MAG: hypothetical protein WD027_07795 [Gaiellales bacterium]